MTTSTTTLLTCVNSVLRMVGDRSVTAFSSPISLVVRDAVLDALTDIQVSHDWEWLKTKIPAITWSNETANLGNIIRIRGVSASNGTHYVPVQFVDETKFDTLTLSSYSSTTGRPFWYTIPSYNIVRLTPYPTTSDTRALIAFYVLQQLIPPVLETDLLPVPDRFVSMIQRLAAAYVAQRHLGDAQTSQMFRQEYDILMTQARSQQRSIPTSGLNMYRR